jgi:hypothetical protein
MPSLSPGSDMPSSFAQILPGAPAQSLKSLTTFTFRWKRYIVYISGKQLNILRSPTELEQAVSFDEELVAVKAEDDQGARIAAASAANVWVLEPHTDNWNHVTWRKVLLLKREDASDETRSLSWGNDGELLVGGSKLLSLFSVLPTSREGTPVRSPVDKGHVEERNNLWSKSIPSPFQGASFSPNASLIASYGPRDRLVKIWRRLSFEEGLFDYAYLPHPGPVTHIEWRGPDAPKLEEDTEESEDARAKAYGIRNEEDHEVLYTFCADGMLRIWKTGGQHDLEVMVLQTSIDLVGAIPHSPLLGSKGASAAKPARYAFVLPSGALSGAITASIAKHHVGKVTHSLEHIKEINSRQPDAVVTFDGLGRMSAWGLQTIGHRRRPSTPPGSSKQAYHIAHAEDLDLKLPVGTNARFESWFDGDRINIIVQTFDGILGWWQGGVEQFFSPAIRGSDRLACVATWSGSRGTIQGLRTGTSESDLLTWSHEGTVTRFISNDAGNLQTAEHHESNTKGNGQPEVLEACLLDDGATTLCVDTNTVFVLGASNEPYATAAHSLSQPIGLHNVATKGSSSRQEFILCDHTGSYATVSVSDPSNPSRAQVKIGERKALPVLDGLPTKPSDRWKQVQVVPHPRKPGWLRLVGAGRDGFVSRRDVPTAALQEESSDPMETALSFPLGFSDPCLLKSTSDVAVVVSQDGHNIVVIDLKDGYVEHRQEFDQRVRSICLNASMAAASHHIGDANNTLAVAFDDSVEILAQARYEPAHSAEHHTWHHLKRISISGIGPIINAVAWLPNGELVIAAGNALLRNDGIVAGEEVVPELRDRLDLSASANIKSQSLVQALRTPLVSWHPHFLQQLSLRGQMHAAAGILRRLERTLRFYTEGDKLDPLLDATPDILAAGQTHPDNSLLDLDIVSSLKQQLEDIDLPKTSDTEQKRLKIMLDTIIYMQEHIGSLDESGFRYLFSWKLHVLELESKRSQQSTGANGSVTNGDEVPPPVVPTMSWREIVFAYHSETQQPLLEALHNYYSGKLDWPTVRKLGIPAWLHAIRAAQSEGSDLASLEQIFDSLAQTAFRSTYPPDPTRASLYFLAMKKKATLLALWRVAAGNREQKTTSNFLKRDFTLEENRTAARKNAYALMGKRRFEYAAAFFLLANDPASAISILAGQCQDLPLAIAVARVYCDDGSPELMKFMEDRVLPEARKAGDRWLLTWGHEIMGHTHLAAQALVLPIDKFEVDDADRKPRHWQQDDPLTLKLYQHLRDKPAKRGRTGQRESPPSLGGEQHEYRAVLRAARILRKMGLWLLALELVSTWHFKPLATLPSNDNGTNGNGVKDTNGAQHEPTVTPSMLDDFETPPRKTEAPKSMLDAFDAPKPPLAPKSLLDDFGSLSLQSPADKAKADREAKAAELMAKLKAKKEQAGNAPPEGEKKAPTQFKEPESSSILDSFGF